MSALDKPVKSANYLTKFLVQDGGSNISGAVNGSITPVNMVYRPTGAVVLHRILIGIVSPANVTSPKYGSITVTNGITISVKNSLDAVILDVTAGNPITTNDNLATHMYDSRQNLFGANPRSVTGRYTFTKDAGAPLLLDGTNGEYFCFTIADDLSTLVEHHIRLGGRLI